MILVPLAITDISLPLNPFWTLWKCVTETTLILLELNLNHVSPVLHNCNIYIHHPKELKLISALRGRHPVLFPAHPCSGRWEMQAPGPHSTLRHPAKSQRVSIRERQLERGPSWPRNSYSISWTTIATRTKRSCDAGASESAGQNAQLQKQL